MAGHISDQGDNSGKTPNDNQETFEGFITATKWGVGLVSLALILMAIFLV